MSSEQECSASLLIYFSISCKICVKNGSGLRKNSELTSIQMSSISPRIFRHFRPSIESLPDVFSFLCHLAGGGERAGASLLCCLIPAWLPFETSRKSSSRRGSLLNQNHGEAELTLAPCAENSVWGFWWLV